MKNKKIIKIFTKWEDTKEKNKKLRKLFYWLIK